MAVPGRKNVEKFSGGFQTCGENGFLRGSETREKRTGGDYSVCHALAK